MTVSAAGRSASRLCSSSRIGPSPSASRVSSWAQSRVAASPSRQPCAITMRWFSSRSYSRPGHSPCSTHTRVGWIAGLGRGGCGGWSGRSGGPGRQGGIGGWGGSEPTWYVIISRVLLLSLPRPAGPVAAR
jgi:hypothetical protein